MKQSVANEYDSAYHLARNDSTRVVVLTFVWRGREGGGRLDGRPLDDNAMWSRRD